MGYPLSSVASTGAERPAAAGELGQRAPHRVRPVPASGCGPSTRTTTIIRSWLVSGSKYNNEEPGVHKVYSRSPSVDGMERQGVPAEDGPLPEDRHRRHRVPRHPDPPSPTARVYKTEAELGTRLSGGCQRQANADAAFMWDFAQIGTTVVVL